MKRYQLVNIYGLAKGEKSETCERCGKAIKDIYVIHDNLENKDLHVGSTCIGKVMNLNENFDVALQKELKKYSKLLKKVNNWSLDKEINNLRNKLIKGTWGQNCVYDEKNKCHRAYTLEEFDNIKNEIKINRIELHESDIKDLELQKEKLNKFSKTGLINIK